MKPNSIQLFIFAFIASLFFGCTDTKKDLALNMSVGYSDKTIILTRDLTEEFKEYWYGGKAEITSYALQQARYGEIRKGTAVNIFVTEDFLAQEQVKANNTSDDNIPVLKFNATKKFLTGIYPYSLMTSTFSPVQNKGHAVKVTNSAQEWCGHVYAQLNNKRQYEIESHSYFEGEADQKLSLPKTWLENELWSLIRFNPEELPTGEAQLIPSFEFMRLRHQEIKAYPATLTLEQGDLLNSYTISYPDLKRDLTIYFNNSFPYEIEKWEETYLSGFGPNTKTLTTTASKIKRIKAAYWSQHDNSDMIMRDSLGLK